METKWVSSLHFLLLGLLLLQLQAFVSSSREENLNLGGQLFKLVRAEGDPVTEGTNAEAGAGAGGAVGTTGNATTARICEAKGNCCAMYTWAGMSLAAAEESGSTAPRECSDLPEYQKDPKNRIACFGPIVYSNGTRRPDPRLVVERCELEELPCFCEGETCLKYTYIRNNDAKTIVNETRFCGTLTNIQSNSPVTSGCYRETISGSSFIREVCACSSAVGAKCNASTGTALGSPIGLIALILFFGLGLIY